MTAYRLSLDRIRTLQFQFWISDFNYMLWIWRILNIKAHRQYQIIFTATAEKANRMWGSIKEKRKDNTKTTMLLHKFAAWVLCMLWQIWPPPHPQVGKVQINGNSDYQNMSNNQITYLRKLAVNYQTIQKCVHIYAGLFPRIRMRVPLLPLTCILEGWPYDITRPGNALVQDVMWLLIYIYLFEG